MQLLIHIISMWQHLRVHQIISVRNQEVPHRAVVMLQPQTLQICRELERASATLAELQGELASEKAAAEADVSTLTAETKEKDAGCDQPVPELEAKSRRGTDR